MHREKLEYSDRTRAAIDKKCVSIYPINGTSGGQCNYYIERCFLLSYVIATLDTDSNGSHHMPTILATY